ncbi:MAG: acyl-phosphate glycerol 3-phosphate acyltransferase [Gammaproteobacteria bacterium]|nr:MAG: acyl-phosphate glycerol 3-phosphate acyltransferase [Gammaproteobacteria bacterium]
MVAFVLLLIIGYLFGSLSSAIIVCKTMQLPDPRMEGSNNPGATNVMRIGGKKAAYLTFAGDCLKGIIPVIIARFIFSANPDWAVAGAALGAFIGHLYPLYFGFKGGKGVATLVGILIAISPIVFLGFGVIWLAILFSTGYVSLASMVGAAATILTAFLFNFSGVIIALLSILSLLVIYRHKSNIVNLLNGTENRFRKN